MHIILTFGFSISINNSNTEDKNDKSIIKEKVKKKAMREHKKKEINKNTNEITQNYTTSKNIIHIGEILAEIHVEYELLPNYNFKFDCRCWETASKVYH